MRPTRPGLPLPGRSRRRRPGEPDRVLAAETWFLGHGLAYFVPAEREKVREALRPRHVGPPLAGLVLLGAVVAVVLVWPLGLPTVVPAWLVSLSVAGVVAYALTALRARSIVAWTLGRTVGSLRLLLPMASRALPLLLVFVTFLFINAEVWQMSAALSPGLLWLTVLLLLALAVLFLLVRLPEEVDRVDDAVDDDFVRRACRGTPLEAAAEDLVAQGVDTATHAQVTGYARWNLVLVLLVLQVAQVVILVAAVFAFFLLFGALVMSEGVQQAWTGLARVHSLPFLPNASVELVQVSLFLAAFSGLYFTVSAVTDDTYRSQFFATVTGTLERAVGTRAVYLLLREGDDEDGVDGVDAATSGG